MKKPTLARSVLRSKSGSVCMGFALVELLTVLTLIGIISAISIPALKNLHCTCCLKAAIYEIAAMIKEGKQNALSNNMYYAVTFNTTDGIISLVSGRGADDKWNTSDDPVVRSFSLKQKGGGLRFSHGSYGPIKEPGKAPLEEAPDGVSFPTKNTCVCNPELTGNAGAVYLMSASGSAMALKMNSKDFGYVIFRWDGKKWLAM